MGLFQIFKFLVASGAEKHLSHPLRAEASIGEFIDIMDSSVTVWQPVIYLR